MSPFNENQKLELKHLQADLYHLSLSGAESLQLSIMIRNVRDQYSFTKNQYQALLNKIESGPNNSLYYNIVYSAADLKILALLFPKASDKNSVITSVIDLINKIVK